MNLINFTQPPTRSELEFLDLILSEDDYFMVSQSASRLMYLPFNHKGTACIRSADVQKLGGCPHDDWLILNEEQWVELTVKTSKTVVW